MKIRAAIFISLAWIFLGVRTGHALPTWADSHLSRDARVKSCAGCHQSEYNDWKTGPHSASFFRLENYRNRVLRDAHYPSEEKKHAQDVGCYECHIQKDRFNSLNPNWDGKSPVDFLITRHFRTETEDRGTGVDCLTCHLAGDHVVTRFEFQPKASSSSPDFCRPQPSRLLSGNAACMNCHDLTDEIAYYNNLHSKTTVPTTCNECHLRKDEQGKSTHHYYWLHDNIYSNDDMRPDSLRPYKKFRVTFKNEKGSKSLKLFWENNFAPHDYVQFPRQTVFKVELLSRLSQPLKTVWVRFAADPIENIQKDPSKITLRTFPFGTKLDQTIPLGNISKDVVSARLSVLRIPDAYLGPEQGTLLYNKVIQAQ